MLDRVEPNQAAVRNHCGTQPVDFGLRAVAPVHMLRPGEGGNFVNPGPKRRIGHPNARDAAGGEMHRPPDMRATGTPSDDVKNSRLPGVVASGPRSCQILGRFALDARMTIPAGGTCRARNSLTARNDRLGASSNT